MSALGELLQKHNTSALDRAVISFSIDDQGDGEDGEDAAAELLALRAELTDAKERAKTAEANWHANEARLNKLQMAVTAFLNEVPESEMNLAREVWGNSNTRITIEKRRELEAVLKGSA